MRKKWFTALCCVMAAGIIGAIGAFITPKTDVKAEETEIYTFPTDYIVGISGWSGNKIAIGVESNKQDVWAWADTATNIINSCDASKVTYTRDSVSENPTTIRHNGKGLHYIFAGSKIEMKAKTPITGDKFEIAEGFTFTLPDNKNHTWTNRTFKYEKPLSYTYNGTTWVSNNALVKFDVDGEITTQLIKSGEKATKPVDPVKDGYLFMGWVNNGSAFDFNTTISGDITLTPNWIKSGYVWNTEFVQTSPWSGTGIGKQVIIVGTTNSDLFGKDERFDDITAQVKNLSAVTYKRGDKTENPTRIIHNGGGVHYGFSGSVITDLSTTAVKGDEFTVTKDFYFALNNNKAESWTEKRAFNYGETLKYTYDGAIWKKTFTVKFISNESVISTENVLYGSTVKAPELSKRDGYIFTGWTLNGESYDFDTPVTSDIELVAQWEKFVAVKTMNLLLNGKIETRFGVELKDETQKNNAYLSVKVGNEEERRLTFADAEKSENGKYYFNIGIAAAQMTENIAVRVITADADSDIQNFTVRKYADYLLKKESSSAELKKLITAMLDYGAYAQVYFGVNTDKLANADLHEDGKNPLDGVTISQSTKTEGSIDGLTYINANMLLEADNTLRLYFKTQNADAYNITVKYNDGKVRTFTLGYAEDTANGRYYVDIPHIPAPMLGTEYEITFKSADATLKVTLSGYSYAAKLIADNSTEAQTNVAKALYLYGEAAANYFNFKSI